MISSIKMNNQDGFFFVFTVTVIQWELGQVIACLKKYK